MMKQTAKSLSRSNEAGCKTAMKELASSLNEERGKLNDAKAPFFLNVRPLNLTRTSKLIASISKQEIEVDQSLNCAPSGDEIDHNRYRIAFRSGRSSSGRPHQANRLSSKRGLDRHEMILAGKKTKMQKLVLESEDLRILT